MHERSHPIASGAMTRHHDAVSFRLWMFPAACVLLALAACSGNDRKPDAGKPPPDAGSDASDSSPDSGRDAGRDSGDGPSPSDDAGMPQGTTLVITPAGSSMSLGSLAPREIEFKAMLSNGAASEVPVRWSSDSAALGKIDAVSGKFVPTGAAGTITIRARAGSLSTQTTLTITVDLDQNGDPDSGSMPGGAGGIGGVGGDGGGSTISDAALREALDKPATSDAGLVWLYPYDGTVWPRGLPAPLLQWKHGAHAALAVKLRIEVAPSYVAEVYLGRPPGLAAGQPIVRMPIPQAIWRNAQQSGSEMKVTLTIAASDGGGGYAAYRAEKNPTWTIAPTTLKGVVYYNSYGTKLAENYGGAQGGNGRFGGATLAIQGDAFDPTLVAGATTNDASGCRVCHTVNSNGSVMLVQHEDNVSSSAYDLRNLNMERVLPDADNGKFGWSALSADGTIALGNAGPPGSNAQNVSSLAQSALYRVADGSTLTVRGLSEFVTQAATPVFSQDGKKVAFNLYAGAGNASIPADGRSIVVMDFRQIDATTYEVSNPVAVYTASGGERRPAWPFFLPDGKSLVFQLELAPGDGNEQFATRKNARGELWWSDLDGHAHALDRANGEGYLPASGGGHEDDTTLHYEPTVAPLVAGGYAWVVFTSRRSYGNVATRPPFESDPREFDLTAGNPGGPTTKKLWVAALDASGEAGGDPSHPAFYLPAQELYAGNSRGYWVLDACKESGGACSGGDECCGGFCRVDEESGIGVCMDVPPDTCAKEFDKCNVDADCCSDGENRLYCIAGRCAVVGLQ